MIKAKRYFNTSGPNIPDEHYTLKREKLIEKGLDLVKRKRYFTIWAPGIMVRTYIVLYDEEKDF